jgi:phosphodiesterase/alkaline phosphatase D-like protein
VTLWAKTIVPGAVFFELFADEACTSSLEVQKVDSTGSNGLVASTSFEHLNSSTTYYYRACVQNDYLKMPGAAAGFFVSGKLTTLPEPDESTGLTFCAVGAPVTRASTLCPPGLNPWAATVDAIAAANPSLVVVNGGVLPTSHVRAIKTTLSEEEKVDRIMRLYQKQLGDAALRRLLSSQVVLFGLNDDSHGSAAALMNEEMPPEKKEEETKSPKKGKKGKRGGGGDTPKSGSDGGDPRGALTPAMKALKTCLPLELEDVATRHAYSRSRFGRRADFFLLDTRGGAVGKTQTAWLNNELAGSGCTWKFVVVPSIVSLDLPVGGGKAGSRPSSKEKKKKSSSKEAAEAAEVDAGGERQGTAAPDSGTVVLAETISFVAAEGISGVVFLTSDERRLSAIQYSPKATGERAEAGLSAPPIHSFGIGPLGPSSGGGSGMSKAVKSLRPTFLIPEESKVPAGAATFGKVDVSAGGSLTYTVCADAGAPLHSVTVEPPKGD